MTLAIPPLSNLAQAALDQLRHLSTVKLPTPKATIGLDIGSSSVKAVALGSKAGVGRRAVLGSKTVAFAEASDAAVQAAIQEAVGAVDAPTTTVNLSICGQAVIMRVIDMPKLAPHELAQALPFEAQRYLPFNLQEVVLDGAIVGSVDGQKLQVLIVACRRDALEQRLALITNAGFQPGLVDVDALAVVNAWTEHADGQARQGTHAIVHVGAQWSNLAIVKDAQPFLVRDIPWGTHKLTKHMAEQLGRPDEAVTESLRHASASGPVPADVGEAMRAGCEALAADLQLSFDFFENHFGGPPSDVAVSGGLARCPGILEALAQHLAQPLASWVPCQGLDSTLSVACGLALRTDVAAR